MNLNQDLNSYSLIIKDTGEHIVRNLQAKEDVKFFGSSARLANICTVVNTIYVYVKVLIINASGLAGQ